MILPDVNVLIYAFRKGVSQHAACRAWLNAVVQDVAPFAVSTLTLGALIRITTNSRSFTPPSSLEDAIGFCDDLLEQPHCNVVEPGERHWDIFRRLCIETDTRGSRVADAWYAALAIEWDCEWITYDRDYARFPGLKWRTPETA